MSFFRLVAVVAISSVLSGSVVVGQSLRGADGPAETPPSSFTAAQYIDSKGCVFIRAGFAGQVQWVPRVARSRKVLCGMQPSLAKVDQAPAAAQRPVAAAATPRRDRPAVGRPLATVALTNAAPRIGAMTPVVNRPAPTPPRIIKEARVAVPQAAPVRTGRVVDVQPRVIAPVTKSSCANRSAVGARYTNSASRNVRCGPQTENPNGKRKVYSNPKSDWVAKPTNRKVAKSTTRKKSRRSPAVYRIVGAAPRVPKGYRPVWTDGRLNPNRGLPKGYTN